MLDPIVGLLPLIACMLLPSPEPAMLLLLSSAAATVSRFSAESNEDHHDDDKQAMHNGWLWLWPLGTSTSMRLWLHRSLTCTVQLPCGCSLGCAALPNSRLCRRCGCCRPVTWSLCRELSDQVGSALGILGPKMATQDKYVHKCVTLFVHMCVSVCT